MTDGWNSPGPIVVNIIGSKREPRCDDAAAIPGRLRTSVSRTQYRMRIDIHTVVNGSKYCAMLRVNELCNEERRGAMRDANSKADKKPGGDEHLEVNTDTLKYNTEDPGSDGKVRVLFMKPKFYHL